MTTLSTITQKSQVTIPQHLRKKFGLKPYSKVAISADNDVIKIKPVLDIIDIAGTLVPKKKVNALKARELMEKHYIRF